MGPGKEGEREVRPDEAKKKHGGNVEKSDRTKKQHVRGAQRVVIALDLIRSRFAEAQGFSTAEEHKQIKKEHFMSDESKSRIKRVGAKLEVFQERKDATRSRNKLQKERGIDKTYLVADRTPYKNTKDGLHLAQLREELKARKDPGELS